MAEAAPHGPGEVIYRGAEATLTTASRFGRLVVLKQRHPKAYRIAELETDIARRRVGARLEERAVDLKAFKDSFAATHLPHAADFGLVLEGYRAVLGAEGARVAAHIGKIERRRRYA